MTAVEQTPASSVPDGANHRPGVHVPAWVGVLVVGLVLAAGAFVIGFAVANRRDGHHDGPFGGRMGGRLSGGHPGVRVIGLLIVLAVIALVIAGIVWGVRALSRRSAVGAATFPSSTRAVSSTANAEHILAERLARGEIDADDYRARLDALRR